MDYIAVCDEEIDTDELRARMQRVKHEIEHKSRIEERVLAMKYARECVYESKKWRKVVLRQFG